MIQIAFEASLEYDVQDPAGADFIFNIQPAATAHQLVRSEILSISQDIEPDTATDPATDTRVMRVHANPGLLVVKCEATIRIEHHVADPDTLVQVPVRSLPLQVMPYLYPSRYCQSDRLLMLAWTQFGAMRPGYSRVLAIQDWVQQQITYVSKSSDSGTSAVDTVLDRVGVCRDFAHLMITLCRALNMPARFVTGVDYGADPALGPNDFHAYVEVFLGDRWYLFDASGRGIPMGFIRIGTGRDAADVAFATIFGTVVSKAPWVQVTASDAPGLVLPRHRRHALSTTPPTGADIRPAEGLAARPGATRRARQHSRQ